LFDFFFFFFFCLADPQFFSRPNPFPRGGLAGKEKKKKKTPIHTHTPSLEMSEEAEIGSTDFYVALGISAGLVVMAGVMSGLTMGLMSLDLTTLRVVAKTGDRRSRRYAAKIIPLVEKHHLLLVTLLLANASAMEALPIFLDKIVSPTISIILSVSLVLMFGEVIPQVGVAWGGHWFFCFFLFCWYFGMCCLCL
jgi:hypothetical protein